MADFKTVKDLEEGKYMYKGLVQIRHLQEEAIRIFKNLQGPDTIYPLILNDFPDSCKGEIAKDKWNDTDFRYGTEYGMLAMLHWLMNLTEEDLKLNNQEEKNNG